MAERSVQLAGREVQLTNLDKVFFPYEGITKGDLVEYYERVAETLLPHVRDRPATLHRFPDGTGEDGFYQKEASEHFPAWIERARVEKEDGQVTHVLIQDATTLVYLANQGTITPHVWLARADRPRQPDRLVFDLDPPEAGEEGFDLVLEGARAARALLESVGLVPFVTTTGSRGLHVVVPLRRERDVDQVRRFARRAAELLVDRDPDRFTVAQRKEKRGGRLLLDYMRNAYAQTAVSPYALRALPRAPVATPLEWDELADPQLDPRRYTIHNIFRRLGQKDDPWKEMGRHARSLAEPWERLEELGSDETGEAAGGSERG